MPFRPDPVRRTALTSRDACEDNPYVIIMNFAAEARDVTSPRSLAAGVHQSLTLPLQEVVELYLVIPSGCAGAGLAGIVMLIPARVVP